LSLRQKNVKKTVVQTGLFSAFRLMGIQSMIVVLISLAWGWHSFSALTSSLLGGAISIVPNAVFASRFFASGRSSNSQKIVRAFYTGELIKLLITVVLVLIVLTQFSSVLILPLLTGFVAATFGLWFAPLLLSLQSKKEVVTS